MATTLTAEEGDDERSYGDARISSEPEPEPEIIKVPDVELIEDGFGFMPKHDAYGETTPKTLPIHEGSICASSTNIDVVRRYTWRTKNRMTVQIISYGATITSVQVPDRNGTPADIVAGFDTLEEYFNVRNPYFGATIGRYANIITEASMMVKPHGRVYMLTPNMGQHHFNGGFVGFDRVNWRSYVCGNKVVMSHVSDHLSEGYPGTLMVQVTFEVTCDNSIKIDMKCTTTETTVVNLSNCLYFNMAGHNAGKDCMQDHIFTINADKYTVADEHGIVTGERKVVGGTVFDFRVPRILRTMLPKIPLGGYDTNYCITRASEQELTFQARAIHPYTGRVVEIYSNQPGMQFYTGNLLPDPDLIIEPSVHEEEEKVVTEYVSDESVSSEGAEEEESKEGKKGVGYIPLLGKGGATYKKHGLFYCMPQNYPDAVNHRNFPSAVLNPGEEYIHRIHYKFGLLLGKYT